MLGKVLACHVLGRRKSCPAARIAAEAYNNHPDLLKAMAAPGLIGKSAMTPAQTTVSGWAAELATPGGLDFWQTLTPASIYSQLSARPGAIRVRSLPRQGIAAPGRGGARDLAELDGELDRMLAQD